MGGARRRSFEAGHRPKFLVVVDGTPEAGRAIRFAARRCARTGARMIMLGIVTPPDHFDWFGVANALREEAEDELRGHLDAAAAQARAAAGIEPEIVTRDGESADAILALIEEDQDVSFLVLGASTESTGPGPLVAGLAGSGSSAVAVPVVIVPGNLSDEAIDALAG